MSQEQNTDENSEQEKKPRKLGSGPDQSPEAQEEKRKLRLERRTKSQTMGSRREIKRTKSGIPLDGSGKAENKPAEELPQSPSEPEAAEAGTEDKLKMPDLHSTAIPFRMAFRSKQSPRYRETNSKGLPESSDERDEKHEEIKPPPPPPPRHSHYLLKTPKPFKEREGVKHPHPPVPGSDEGGMPPPLPPEALIGESKGGGEKKKTSRLVLIGGMAAVFLVVVTGVVMIVWPLIKNETGKVKDGTFAEETVTELTSEFEEKQQPAVAKDKKTAVSEAAGESTAKGVTLKQQPATLTPGQVLNSKAVQNNVARANGQASSVSVQKKAEQMGVSPEKLQDAVSAAKNGATAAGTPSSKTIEKSTSVNGGESMEVVEVSDREFSQEVIQSKAAEMGVSEKELEVAIAEILASEKQAATKEEKVSPKLNGSATSTTKDAPSEGTAAKPGAVKAVQTFKAREESSFGESDRLPYAKIKQDKAVQEVISESVEDVPTGPDPMLITWLESAKISSVIFKGDDSRMILDGKIYFIGSIVNPRSELRWVKVNASKHELYFQDEHGNIYLKRH